MNQLVPPSHAYRTHPVGPLAYATTARDNGGRLQPQTPHAIMCQIAPD